MPRHRRQLPPAILLELQLKAERIQYAKEVKFHTKRRWRADFWMAKKDGKDEILVEVEGGIWRNGRHVRPSGYEKDCEKYNEATILGYHVLRFTPSMIRSGYAIDTIKRAMVG